MKLSTGNPTPKSVRCKTPWYIAHGIQMGNVVSYLGLPYAQATSQEQRFSRAKRLQASAVDRDASRYGAIAVQHHHIEFPQLFGWLKSDSPMSENCLTLNVYAPEPTAEKHPVVVYFHGGSFSHGASSAPCLNGARLAQSQQVVVVTVNHRLNVFGYLNAGDEHTDAGFYPNAGLDDLVTSLEWVQDTIAAFGGDARKVTIMGQSGGAAKVAMLMAMPDAQGLFHQAIIQSPVNGFLAQSADQSLEAYERLCRLLELKSTQFDALKRVDASQLLAAHTAVIQEMKGYNAFRPTALEISFGTNNTALEIQSPVPVMIGVTQTEASFYLLDKIRADCMRLADAAARLQRFLKVSPDVARGILAGYGEHYAHGVAGLFSQVVGDYLFTCPTLGMIQTLQQTNQPLYVYQFAMDANPALPHIGSPHTGELPFIFNQLSLPNSYITDSEANRRYAQQMGDWWGGFIREGRPHASGTDPWQAYNYSGKTMVMREKSVMAKQPDQQALVHLDGIAAYFPGNPFNFK